MAGTLLLVGLCTTAMLVGLFMMYVKTTLAPALDVNADDYTMNLSSIIYYQDKESGEWVEYQTIYGDENRIWVDYDQMPAALSQAAVAIETTGSSSTRAWTGSALLAPRRTSSSGPSPHTAAPP